MREVDAVRADMATVNPNVMAFGLGRSLRAIGTTLIMKAVHELARVDGGRVLVTMCSVGGLGTGTFLRRV